MRLFVLLSISITLSSCFSVDKNDDSKMIFSYNESSGIHSFDPAFAKDQARIWFCNQVYNSLLQLDSNLQIKPSIAKRWEVSTDARQYDFILRDDVFFHENHSIFGERGS